MKHDRIVEPVSLRNAEPEARAVLDRLRKDWSKVPVSFAFMAAQPKALDAFADYAKEVIYNGPLDPKLRELAYLRTAMLAGCKLCVANHAQAARDVDVEAAKIDAIGNWDGNDTFTALEQAVLRFAEHVASKPGKAPADLLSELHAGLGNDGVVALTQVIGLANLFSRFNNALHTYSDADIG